jgi:[ribosomal protein S18]-alanine N-acetyltransferase
MTQNDRPPGVKLRPMVLSDVEAVLRIERASFSTPWPRDAFIYELARPHRSICLVAEYHGEEPEPEVVGDVVVWQAGSTAHVATLAVHPSHRRRGIASCLLANALLTCIDRGLTLALLEVRAQNNNAQLLYQKFGFRRVGIREGYYQDTGEDAVLMALKPLKRDELAEFANCG